MNAPLRRVAVAVMVLFALLILNANYVQWLKAEDLRADPGNTRVRQSEYGRQRGSIVVDGQAVARSEATSDQLKYLRQYPKGPIYAHSTGWYSLLYNASGIERAENSILSGDDDELFTSNLRDLFTGRDPKGGNVVLTLDQRTQETAYQAMAGKHVGAVVALDPRSGEILAMVSTPSYDPGRLSSHDFTAMRQYGDSLESAAPDPRVNRATERRYFPGSTFKVVVSAAALQDGDKDYSPDTEVDAPTDYTLPGTETPLPNFEGESCGGGGKISLQQALTISCNTAFAILGIDLGEDALRTQAERFGITDEGFEMPLQVEGSTLGNMPGDAARGQASIGQREVQITPLQGAMIAAGVANDGVVMKPYLVKEVQAPDLSTVRETDESQFSVAMTKDAANELTQMMVSVVDNGTGRGAHIEGVEVAGKTGTAESSDVEGAPEHAWFIGFAPADNPTVAVAVLLERAGTTGGRAAAPIAGNVIRAALESQGGR